MSVLKVAITGAGGLVGSHLAEYLANKGHKVKALVRSFESVQSFKDSWQQLGIEISVANVLQKEEMRNALNDIDVVVHAAAIVDPYAPANLIDSVNVLGCRSVLEAAQQAGVRQFVFVSSLSVITGNKDQYNSDENAPWLMCGEPYADSKVKAERIVTAQFNNQQIAITIVRPGFIYGPRERAWLPRVINSITHKQAVLVDGGKRQTNVIYIGNLNVAIEATLLNEKAFGQIYNLTDGENITKKQLFDTISKELSLPLVKKDLPRFIVQPVFIIISSLVPFLPIPVRKKLARFSMAAYRLIGVNQSFSIAKAEAELGYTKRIPFSVGMAETLRTFSFSVKPDKVAAGVK